VSSRGVAPEGVASRAAPRCRRGALFISAAVSHPHPRSRPNMAGIVPASLPAPAQLVTATGALELLGAIGLLVPQALPLAAYGLIALLVAMFPANVHAAREGLMVAGRRATPVLWRLPLQLFWIAALWLVRSP